MTPEQAIRAAALAAAIEHTKAWARTPNVYQLAEVANAFAKYIKTGKMGRMI